MMFLSRMPVLSFGRICSFNICIFSIKGIGVKGLSSICSGENAVIPYIPPKSMSPFCLLQCDFAFSGIFVIPSLLVKFLNLPLNGLKQLIPFSVLIHSLPDSSSSIPCTMLLGSPSLRVYRAVEPSFRSMLIRPFRVAIHVTFVDASKIYWISSPFRSSGSSSRISFPFSSLRQHPPSFPPSQRCPSLPFNIVMIWLTGISFP